MSCFCRDVCILMACFTVFDIVLFLYTYIGLLVCVSYYLFTAALLTKTKAL